MKKFILISIVFSLFFATACSSVPTTDKSGDSSVIESVVSETSASDVESNETTDVSSDFDASENQDEESFISSVDSQDENTSINESESEENTTELPESENNSIASSEVESEELDTTSYDSESVDSDITPSDGESSVNDSVSREEEEENEDSAVVSAPEPDGAVFVSNGILISGTRGMEQYYGSEASGSQYSAYVSAFKDDLGADVNVYSVVVPHASCYYAPSSYANLITRGQVNFSNLKAKAGADVNYVDVYATLAKHVDEDIYPRTEHHWNALGAYYAAEEFAKMAGVDFAPLSSFEKIVKEGFVGTLYAFSKSSVLLNNPEEFVIYRPTQEYTAYFCNEGNYNFDNYNYSRSSVVFDVKSYAGAFLGGDSVWVKIVTGNNTGRKLVIFKDSYGNAFVPFTVGSFDEIYVLDLRNYNRNGVDFCEDVGATDVAFVVSGFTATGTVYKNIEKIRTAP